MMIEPVKIFENLRITIRMSKDMINNIRGRGSNFILMNSTTLMFEEVVGLIA